MNEYSRRVTLTNETRLLGGEGGAAFLEARKGVAGYDMEVMQLLLAHKIRHVSHTMKYGKQ